MGTGLLAALLTTEMMFTLILKLNAKHVKCAQSDQESNLKPVVE